MRIDVISIFPRLFGPFLSEAFPKRAQEQGLLEVRVHDLRDFTEDRHRSVDAAPYGGGPGMVMRPEPLVAAIESVAGPKGPEREAHVVLLTPQGDRLEQRSLDELAFRTRIVLVCGRFEGVDARVVELAVDAELSIGDYVLSGGEIPAMAVIEGLVRLLPGVLGNPESVRSESFAEISQRVEAPAPDGHALLEGPQYTRPPIFRGLSVPDVLSSGDHGAIERWRRAQALEVTQRRRPDLVPPSHSKEKR